MSHRNDNAGTRNRKIQTIKLSRSQLFCAETRLHKILYPQLSIMTLTLNFKIPTTIEYHSYFPHWCYPIAYNPGQGGFTWPVDGLCRVIFPGIWSQTTSVLFLKLGTKLFCSRRLRRKHQTRVITDSTCIASTNASVLQWKLGPYVRFRPDYEIIGDSFVACKYIFAYSVIFMKNIRSPVVGCALFSEILL